MYNANLKSNKTWAITTFFNPEHHKNKLKNYRLFKDNLAKQGVSLLTVECAFKFGRFELKKSEADVLIRVRSNSVLWQKERLLNIALSKLPSACENIVWIDADVIFLDNNWLEKTEKLLDNYSVVQPFSRAVRLNNNEKINLDDFNLIDSDRFRSSYAYYYINENNLEKKDHKYISEGGFVWAGKKSIFDECGFYDYAIVGGADWLMNNAFIGEKTDDKFLKEWSDRVYNLVKGNIYYLDGKLIHLYHGELKNRYYLTRSEILSEGKFIPDRDLILNKYKCWQWSSLASKELKNSVANYFSARNESNKKTPEEKREALKELPFMIMGKIGILIKKISPQIYNFLKRK